MTASYLAADRDLDRIASDADVDMLAPTLVGPHICCSPTGKPPGRGRSDRQGRCLDVAHFVREQS